LRSLTKGWSNAQKEELCRLVAQNGAQWTLISQQLGRTAYACRAAFKRIADKDTGGVVEMPKRKSKKPTRRPTVALGLQALEKPWEKDEVL
jgi:predicted RNA-binding protein YlxR (DUF448 family)